MEEIIEYRLSEMKRILAMNGIDCYYRENDNGYTDEGYWYSLTWWIETECCAERNVLLVKKNGNARYVDCIADYYFFNLVEHNLGVKDIMNYKFPKGEEK